MSDRQLTRYVDVYDDHGVAHSFGPGDDVPAWARSKINRTDAWVTPGADDAVDDVPGDMSDVDDNSQVSEPDEPPRTGRGSAIGAWKAYAARIGVDVDDDMSRDDIIEAVDAL